LKLATRHPYRRDADIVSVRIARSVTGAG
jgi:hypothetical protein